MKGETHSDYFDRTTTTVLTASQRAAARCFRSGGPIEEIAELLGTSIDETNAWLDALELKPRKERTAHSVPRAPGT